MLDALGARTWRGSPLPSAPDSIPHPRGMVCSGLVLIAPRVWSHFAPGAGEQARAVLERDHVGQNTWQRIRPGARRY